MFWLPTSIIENIKSNETLVIEEEQVKFIKNIQHIHLKVKEQLKSS